MAAITIPAACTAGYMVWRDRHKPAETTETPEVNLHPAGTCIPAAGLSGPLSHGLNGGIRAGIDGVKDCMQIALGMLIETGMTEADARYRLAGLVTPAPVSLNWA